MARIGSVCSSWPIVFICIFLLGSADPTVSNRPVVIPSAGQPDKDFYNAAGTGVTIEAAATPTEVTRDQWITYSLTITHLSNALQVVKPSLKDLPEFALFQIEQGSDLDPRPEPLHPDRRIFVYKLRPASENSITIPEVVFRYYDPQRVVPASQPGKRFPFATSNAVQIIVHSSAKNGLSVGEPLAIPPFAQTLATKEEYEKSRDLVLPAWVWFVIFCVPPFLAWVWVVVWKRLYPDAARLVQIERNRAARVILDFLKHRSSSTSQCSFDELYLALITYFQDRFALPRESFTPLEVGSYLRSIHCSEDRIQRTQTLLAEIDEKRFATGEELSLNWFPRVKNLIVLLEESA